MAWHWPKLAKDVQECQIPVKYLDENGQNIVRWEPWPIMDVHAILHFLFDDAKIEVPDHFLEDCWKKSKQYGEEFAQDLDPADYKRTMPIGIYGDGARIRTTFGSENIIAVFCNVILWRPKSVRYSRFLVFTIPEERCTSATLPVVYRRVTWSCNHSWYGFFPCKGPYGEGLPAKQAALGGLPLTKQRYRFQTTEIRGDWAWHKKVFKFDGCHWTGDRVCPFCDATAISGGWESKYRNIESNQHSDFDLVGFLANRIPRRGV